MGANPANFNGQQFYIPGAYSQRNFISNEGGGVSVGNIAILGESSLGEPQKLLVFSDINEAIAELGSGEGLDGVLQAFEPGNDQVPQQVGFMRVNDGTQSFRDISLVSTPVYRIKSANYGVPMNQLKAKISAGTTAGTYKLEAVYKGSETEEDDIEKQSFSIQYVGAGTTAVMTIDATHLTTSIDVTADNLSITLADYPTISELVAVIDADANYEAVVLADDEVDLSTLIDFATGQTILASPFTVKSDYQAIFEALEGNSFFTDVTKSGTIRTVPTMDSDFVYLAGGTSGSYTTAEFTTALAVLEQEDVQLIATTSTDASVHLLIKNHVVSMNSITGRRERQFYVGGALAESAADAAARAKVLNSSFGSLCYPGYSQYRNGVEHLYAPSYYACKQVGMVSATALNTPTTSKSPNILRWEKTLSTTELNTLIKGGVLAGGVDQKNNYITVRAVTTTTSSLIQQVEASVMRETLMQDADFRLRVETAVIGTPGIGNAQLLKVDTIFLQTISDWLSEGTIVSVGGKTSKGYTRSLSGDTIRITYGTWNTVGTNFVFITHNILVPTA